MDKFYSGPISGKAHFLALLGSFVIVGIVGYLVRKGLLKTIYSLLWFVIGGIIIILSVFTNLLYIFSDLIGIYYIPAAIFTVLFTGVIIMLIHFSVVITRQERQIKNIAQEIGLLNKYISDLKKRLKG